MAKPKAATFPRLPRFRHAHQPTNTHSAVSIPKYPHEITDHLHERVETSDIMLGVVAYLDIRTDDGDDVSQDFEDALIAMGAKVRKTFTENITHLVFKNGSVSTMQRAYAKSIPVVNLLWITRSQTLGCKLDEKQFSIVRPANLSVSARRRRISMEPGRVKELVLDPRRFSSSWMDNDNNDDIETQPDSVNAKDMARLSLDDSIERPSSLKLSRRQSIGGIRQSALKFTKDLQQEGMASVNKDVTTPMQGLHTEQGEAETDESSRPDMKTLIPSQASSHEDPPSLKQDTGQPSTPPNMFTSRIPVPRSTLHTQLEASSSGLCFAVRSRLSSNRKPIRSQSASSVMTVPSIKPNIKSNFYFGSPQDNTVSKPPVTSSLKRKRRSSIGPRLSLQGLERTPFVERDIIIPIAKQPKIDRKTIVLTSMDKQTRRACIDAVEKLGIYTIGDEVDGSTTHIIVGCKRRTISVVFGILRGLWLVTADWLKTSAEDETYLPEQQYEIVEWFPKCKMTRLLAQENPGVLPGAKLLGSRQIYVGKTLFDSKLIKKLVEECGASVCEHVESAALIVGTEADQKTPTVIENWLFDCIEQFKDLLVDPYLLR